MTAAPITRRTRTAQECADTLGVSIDYVRDLLNSGELPGKKFGNRWIVADTALDAFIENVIGKRDAS